MKNLLADSEEMQVQFSRRNAINKNKARRPYPPAACNLHKEGDSFVLLHVMPRREWRSHAYNYAHGGDPPEVRDDMETMTTTKETRNDCQKKTNKKVSILSSLLDMISSYL